MVTSLQISVAKDKMPIYYEDAHPRSLPLCGGCNRRVLVELAFVASQGQTAICFQNNAAWRTFTDGTK